MGVDTAKISCLLNPAESCWLCQGQGSKSVVNPLARLGRLQGGCKTREKEDAASAFLYCWGLDTSFSVELTEMEQ
jgi:hypothetical protein